MKTIGRLITWGVILLFLCALLAVVRDLFSPDDVKPDAGVAAVVPTARLVPTSTPTVTATATDTATVTPTVTGTPPTLTPTPTATETPLPPTAMPTDTATTTLTPIPPGMSRMAPAPLGFTVRAQDDVTVMVQSVGRGRDAWKAIEQANMFNSRPDEGREYVLATLRVGYEGDATDTRSITSAWFRAVGDNGTIYSGAWVVLDKKLDMELFGGGFAEGQIAFEVAEGETGLMIIYDSGIGTSAWYLALE